MSNKEIIKRTMMRFMWKEWSSVLCVICALAVLITRTLTDRFVCGFNIVLIAYIVLSLLHYIVRFIALKECEMKMRRFAEAQDEWRKNRTPH